MPISVTRHYFNICLVFLVCVPTVLGEDLRSDDRFESLRRTAIVRAVDQAAVAVVNIHGRKTVRSEERAYNSGENFRQVNGMGTGILVDERGYILTNHHVVNGVSRIQVTLHDKRTLVGRLIDHDHATDLAIIKISVKDKLPTIKVGTSRDLMLAEPVVAVGNPYGYGHSVTRGIISALHRSVPVSDSQHYHDLIQTDASINPGNSGGPLLNAHGEMIGINVAVRVGAQGIGFAIPVDEAMGIAATLLAADKISSIVHGVRGRTVYRTGNTQFVVDSSLDKKLQADDTILRVEGVRIERAFDFERALLGRRSGNRVTVDISRRGEPQTIELALQRTKKGNIGPSDNTVAEQAWQLFGLRLEQVSPNVFQRLKSNYRGGLRVVAVRHGSPAEKEGIESSDILVGMYKWETVSMQNLEYILKSPEIEERREVKFYILRDDEALYGHMRVARR